MTWAYDGRATFEYGDEVHGGQPHIIWRRVGTHAICLHAVDNVRVGRQAGLWRVAELLCDVGDRPSLPYQQGGEGVAKVVWPGWSERVERAPPPVPVVMLGPPLAVRAREYEAGVRSPSWRHANFLGRWPAALGVRPRNVVQLGEASPGRPVTEGAVRSAPVIEVQPAR